MTPVTNSRAVRARRRRGVRARALSFPSFARARVPGKLGRPVSGRAMEPRTHRPGLVPTAEKNSCVALSQCGQSAQTRSAFYSRADSSGKCFQASRMRAIDSPHEITPKNIILREKFKIFSIFASIHTSISLNQG